MTGGDLLVADHPFFASGSVNFWCVVGVVAAWVNAKTT